MDVAKRSKAFFKDKLDKEVVEMVESWGEEQQDYFWTYAYHLLQQTLDAKMIEQIMLGDRKAKPVGLVKPPVPSSTPFRDAEGTIHPGTWFTKGDKWFR